MIARIRARFPLGRIVATPGALAALREADQFPGEFLERHVQGDWGVICDEDKGVNEIALLLNEYLLSAYLTNKGKKIWVVTVANRSSTCLMLPNEY